MNQCLKEIANTHFYDRLSANVINQIVFIATMSHLDECETGLIKCSDNSLCKDSHTNANGTAICTCKNVYTENRTLCNGK